MESIELERGWLARQMHEVRQDVQSWPAVLTPLRTLNSSLVYRSNLPETTNDQALNRTTSTDAQK